MRSPLHILFRKIVFWVGDVRRLRTLPWVTWDVSQHRIELDEVLREALPRLQIGDIILHRDEGYLSNLFIGGFLIHAGIYVGDGYVVEALSEGVTKRHAAHILHSDYAMILRPKFDTACEYEDAILDASRWAEKCVGCEYDALFTFDVEVERKAIDLGLKGDVYLACTEVPLLCYAPHREKLNIKTKRNITAMTRALSWFGLNTGADIVDADMYVTANFDIVWHSRSLTVKAALQHGCSQEFIDKLAGVKK